MFRLTAFQGSCADYPRGHTRRTRGHVPRLRCQRREDVAHQLDSGTRRRVRDEWRGTRIDCLETRVGMRQFCLRDRWDLLAI